MVYCLTVRLLTLSVNFLGCFITILESWQDLNKYLRLEYVNTNAYVNRHTFTSPESAEWLGYTALEMQYLGPRAGMHSVFSKLPLAKGAKDSIRTPILCPSASPSLPGQSSREGLSRAHSDGFQSKGNHVSGYHPQIQIRDSKRPTWTSSPFSG